jgi:hypothetical protein
LNGQGFEHVQDSSYGNYCSSTSYVDDHQNFIWMLNMSNGSFSPGSSSSAVHHVWPVRSGQQNYPDRTFPANVWKTGQTASYHSGDDGDLQYGVAWPGPRFIDHSDGTVSDNLTGLMWIKDANCFSYLDVENTWITIADFNVNSGGYGCTDYTASYEDWRLSNLNELLSLIDHRSTSYSTPSLPAYHPFINIINRWFRSSNTSAEQDNSYNKWGVDINTGFPYDNYGESSLVDFWLVRGGVHQDGSVNLSDAVTALQIVAGIVPTDAMDIGADVNGDGKIGIEEAIYYLKEAAGF